MTTQQSPSWSQGQTRSQTRSPWYRIAQRLAPRMRYPQLFLILLGLFCVDLFIPDPIPFVDEIMLGLLTVLFGMLREREQPEPDDPHVQQP